MDLPVTADYLALSLAEETTVGRVALRRRTIADLRLSSGRLIVSDAFIFDPTPLDAELPRGEFPVSLSITHIETDQRVAFAVIQFTKTPPFSWRMLAFPGQDIGTLKPDEFFGYGVDSGTGCFIDASAAQALERAAAFDIGNGQISPLCQEMIAAMDRT
jgi:hypothetical protein